jgi:HPr kinase/phosphorylase
MRIPTATRKEFITVRELLSGPVQLRSLVDDIGLDNRITDKSLHRPQLALTGFTELFTYYRVQLFGNTEFFYLKSCSADRRREMFANICSFSIPVIVCANDHELDEDLLRIARERGIAVLTTPFDTTKTIYVLSEFLDDQFGEQVTIHGSFVDVYGVGMLFAGDSGIGKSEIALDLVERGHRLVTDDATMLTKKRESILMGTGSSLVKHLVEIRGLGLIDVRQMFGIRSIRFQKRLEIIVELEVFDGQKEYDRLGLDESTVNIMGVEIHAVKLPIFPGKNITVISETIALNYLLRTYGYHAPREFSDQLNKHLTSIDRKNTSNDLRNVSYFQSDDE